MKKILIILGSVVSAIVLIVASVFYATSGAVETVDTFFAEVAADDLEGAKRHLSEGFKASTSDQQLAAFLEGSGLLDYRESDWGGRSVDTSSGTLTGKVITNSGGTIPVTVTFVREDGAWKIYHIQTETAGIDPTVAEQVRVPSRSEASEIVHATTQEFARAANAGDLGPIHESAALEFKEQISLEQLHENFAPFLDQEIDLTVLQNYEPMFTTDPALSAEGVLRLEGYFPTTPSRAHFSYTYVHRDDRWQLLGINISLREAGE